DYLSKVSLEWEQKVGRGASVNWPVGLGGKGNEGVTATVKQTPGAIGYVELGYAMANKLPAGSVRNKAGKFITPALESLTAAAAEAAPAVDRSAAQDDFGRRQAGLDDGSSVTLQTDCRSPPFGGMRRRGGFFSLRRYSLVTHAGYVPADDYAPDGTGGGSGAALAGAAGRERGRSLVSRRAHGRGTHARGVARRARE